MEFQDAMVFNNGALQAQGSVAQRLLANGFKPEPLRPYLVNKGTEQYPNWVPHITVNGKAQVTNTTATLRYDEWKAIDKAVVTISRQRLVAAADLQSRGLTFPIANGMGTTVLQWETQSDYEAAEIDMAALKQSEEDRPVFEVNYLPLPIIHKSFTLSARNLAASRNGSSSLITVNAESAARKVAEKIEDVILLGASTFSFGGGVLYGYRDFTHKNDVTLSANWDDSSTTGTVILNDVQSMISSAQAARHYGPFILYIPQAYDVIMDNDFKAASDRTIRERILALNAISDIRVADRLTANNVLLVEMSPETVKLVVGMPVTTLQWEEQGGLLLRFKVMAIMVPWLRVDQEEHCGIVHLAA